MTIVELEKIKTLAELMDWKFTVTVNYGWCEAISPDGKKFTWWAPDEFEKFLKRAGLDKLLISLDAIVPVIRRQDLATRQEIAYQIGLKRKIPRHASQVEFWALLVLEEPSQLVDALLITANKIPTE